jgi:hypothetical protein
MENVKKIKRKYNSSCYSSSPLYCSPYLPQYTDFSLPRRHVVVLWRVDFLKYCVLGSEIPVVWTRKNKNFEFVSAEVIANKKTNSNCTTQCVLSVRALPIKGLRAEGCNAIRGTRRSCNFIAV